MNRPSLNKIAGHITGARSRLGQCICAALMLLITCTLTGAHSPQPIDPNRVAQVKAGQVLQFIRYTQWPADVFEHVESPFEVVLLGHDALLEDYLIRMFHGQQVHGRRIVFRRITHPIPRPGEREVDDETMRLFHERIRRAHAVYIADSERFRIRRLLSALHQVDVLTMSDIQHFAELGGMIGHVLDGPNIIFEANPDEIRKTRINVSSQVLRLARTVKTRPEQ